MGYQFSQTDPSAQKALRRIAREQIDTALAAVRADGPTGPRIHQMRKSVKKLRGLIRLVRPGFSDFAPENAALRDAARGLSARREAAVNLATLNKLLPEANVSADLADTLRAALSAPEPADTSASADALTGFADAMTALRGRSKDWKLDADGFDAVSGGLEQTWKRARHEMAAALDTPTTEAVHEWRKRVKDHWYHARLLSPIWPEAMAPHVETADRLGEALGDHHDLAVLVTALESRGIRGIKPILAAARKRQSALIAAARTDSGRLFADSAPCLVARWGAWWRIWRA